MIRAVFLGACIAAVVCAVVGSGGADATGGPGTVVWGTQVYVVGANGRGMRELTSGRVSHGLLFWFPGGNAVADVADVGNVPNRAWVQSQRVTGAGHWNLSGKVSVVGPPPSVVFSAASRLAAVIFPGRRGIMLERLGAPGSRPRMLDSWRNLWGVGSLTPAWSPNGRLLAYVRADGPLFKKKPNLAGAMRIAVIGADGRGRRVLSRVLASDQVTPAFSPNGRSILFCANSLGAIGWNQTGLKPVGRVVRSGLFSVSTHGGAAHRITRGRCNHDGVAWSPDGRKIAYVGGAGDSLRLSVVDLRTGRMRTLARVGLSTITGPLAWSADGRKIAFVNSPPTGKPFSSPVFRIETIKADGGDLRPLFKTYNSILDLAWSPNSRQIAFTRGPGVNPFY